MQKNHLYTRSYFVKRLKEAGLPTRDLAQFPEGDVKRWSIIVCPDIHNISITCFKNSPEDFWFKLEYNNCGLTIKTLSMEIIINELKNTILKSVTT